MGVSLAVLLTANVIGLFPDDRVAILKGRTNLCELIAVSSWDALRRDDIPTIERTFSALQKRNPSIKSMAIRRVTGELVVRLNGHDSEESYDPEVSPAKGRLRVPIRANGTRWGAVEVDFEPIAPTGLWQWMQSPFMILSLYFTIIGGLAYYTVFRQLSLSDNRVLVVSERNPSWFDMFPEAMLSHEPDDHLIERRLSDLRAAFQEQIPIPYSAISGLLAALAFRDLRTAEHSKRVSDLCVSVAEGRMPTVDVFILETAALLHDIGKIGVPDHILLKPAPLTDEEWQVMKTHDQIGVEIIRASFGSEQLARIIETHHAFFGGGSREESLPTGYDIPLGARILTIADAYDAMVTDRIYRKGCSTAEAFAELRRCASSQFDPELVERFIEVVQQRIERGLTVSVSLEQEGAHAVEIQVRRIAAAFDKKDFDGLSVLATQLHVISLRYNLAQLSDDAARLETAIKSKDVLAIIDSINSLVESCERPGSTGDNIVSPISCPQWHSLKSPLGT